MNITNAQFTATGSITALVDGVQMSIPADAGNRHYAEILRQVEAGTLTIQDAE